MERAMKDSGIEWIGEIPADWNVTKIKYFYDCYDGRRVPVDSAERKSGPYPYWGAGSITDYVDDYLFDEELILLGEDGAPFFDHTRPVAFLVNEKVWVNNHIHVLKPKPTVNSRFLVHWLNNVDYKSYINGSILNKLTQSNMNSIAFAVPPLDEQQRIAAFLDGECARIDSVVEKTRASIEEYRKLKQSIITRAVTKGIRPNRPTKDSGVEWLGQIPESYDVRRIKYLGSYRNGLTYTPNELVDETEGTLVLRSSNIQQGQLCFTDNVYVKTDIPDRLLVQKGDIIICSRNGSRDLIGKCAIVENDMVASFGAFMMIFRCVAPKYMYYILNSDVFKYYLSTFRTSTINQLTSENFGNMEIVWCADKTEQKEIAAYLDEKTAAIDSLVAKKNRLVSELESLKKSLIFEYVTGKKEVPT